MSVVADEKYSVRSVKVSTAFIQHISPIIRKVNVIWNHKLLHLI